jgi:hypothetical protein
MNNFKVGLRSELQSYFNDINKYLIIIGVFFVLIAYRWGQLDLMIDFNSFVY